MRLFIDIRMCSEECALLALRQRRHAVHVVVAVALDMGDAEKIDEGQVLLDFD